MSPSSGPGKLTNMAHAAAKSESAASLCSRPFVLQIPDLEIALDSAGDPIRIG